MRWAFDVQVYDPKAPVFESVDGVAVTPGDPGYPTAPTLRSLGAFVDLGYGVHPKNRKPVPVSISDFAGPPHPKSLLPLVTSRLSEGLVQSSRYLLHVV